MTHWGIADMPHNTSGADRFIAPPKSRRLQSLIREHHDDIARSIVLEQGKTFADAKGDVLRGLQVRVVPRHTGLCNTCATL